MSISSSCFFQKKPSPITSNENLRTELAKHKLHSLTINAAIKGKIGQKFEQMIRTGKKNLFLGTRLPEDIVNQIKHHAEHSEICDDIKNKRYFTKEDNGFGFYKLVGEILNDDIPENQIEEYGNNKLNYNINKYILQSSVFRLKCKEILRHTNHTSYNITASDINYTLLHDKKFAKLFCQKILKPIVKERKQKIQEISPTSPHPELDLFFSNHTDLRTNIKKNILDVFNSNKNDLQYNYSGEASDKILHPFLKIISTLEHLKKLTLREDFDLEHIQESTLHESLNQGVLNEIGHIKQLSELTLENTCYIPKNIKGLTQLKTLHITDDYGHLKNLPEEICELEQLEKFILNTKSITELPNKINNLKQLKKLELWCYNLRTLPETIGNCTNLTDIDLRTNTNLTRLPDSISQLTNLRNLFLQGTGVEYHTLPENIRNNENIYIDIAPARVDIRGRQSVHAEPIQNKTKEIITFLQQKYPSFPSPEQQNKTIQSVIEKLKKELKKYVDIHEFIPAGDAIEDKQDRDETSHIRYFYKKNNSQKKTLVKVIALKNNQDITYLQPTKKWKIIIAIKECVTMLSQELRNIKYKPKEIFTLAMQFLEEMTTSNKLEKDDMIDNIIDTLYDNRRTYNQAPIENETRLDDQNPIDMISCIPGCVNRIAMMAGLYIDVKPSLPSSAEYSDKGLFIVKETLKDIFSDAPSLISQNITPEIKNNVREEEEITPELWTHIKDIIRERLHKEYEYCGLNKDNDTTLWNDIENNYPYYSINDILNTKGKKTIKEQSFTPNISAEDATSSSHG